jgi:hypothetical protein
MGFMPYPWEKGFFPTAIEDWFNEELDAAVPNDTPKQILTAREGPKRRLRAIWRYADVCRRLRLGAANPAQIRTVTRENSIVESGLFSYQEVADTGIAWQEVIARDWFGMEKLDGTWYRQDPATWAPSKSLGHWNGYFGNVELIVCETLQRMLELSLGVPHLELTAAPSGGDVDALVNDIRDHATRVWPVYMFLSCPNPWFEGWVTWQCHDTTSPLRGQVTVVLSTPSHDRPVTPSPIDVAHDTNTLFPGTGTTMPNPYYLHGREPGPPNRGYKGDYITITSGVAVTASGSVLPATFNRAREAPTGDGVVKAPHAPRHHQGMWLVTHANHDSTIVWNNFPEPKSPNWNQPNIEAWDLPPFAVHRCAALGERRDLGGTTDPAALTGMYDVVVVQPASLDGGVW